MARVGELRGGRQPGRWPYDTWKSIVVSPEMDMHYARKNTVFKNGMPCREAFPAGFLPNGTIEHLSSGKNSIEYTISTPERRYVLKISLRDEKTRHHLISYEDENEILRRMVGSAYSVHVYRRCLIRYNDGAVLCCTLMHYLPPFLNSSDLNWLSGKEILQFGISIFDALIDCRDRGVIYTDLKPMHFLRGKTGNVVFCDFDSAISVEKNPTNYLPLGTPLYMAPEVYHGQKHTERSAIYSVGLILYLMSNNGKYPFVDEYFSGINQEEALAKAGKMRLDLFEMPLTMTGPPANFSFIPDCIMRYDDFCSFDPAKRPQTFEEAREILVQYQGYAMSVMCPFSLQRFQPVPCLPEWMTKNALFEGGIEPMAWS